MTNGMLCLVHGYGLTGSGSNQWSRSIAEGMVRNGEMVHLVCQERRPEAFDFVSEAFTYDADGVPTRTFRREIPYAGTCILHRPELDLLPTYVRPQASNTYMASILDLTSDQVAEYLRRNERALRRIFETYDIAGVQVNHVVLMAVAVQRACEVNGIPYGVLPHGSAIEYVVKHDERMHSLAEGALRAARRIFVLSDELRERIRFVFPEVEDAAEKMVPASAGVDTEQFRLIDRSIRRSSIRAMLQELRAMERGKPARLRRRLRSALRDDMTLEELLTVIAETEDYPPKLPDESIDGDLESVNWERDEIIVFVGKLIGYKGLPALLAAFPRLAAQRPRLRLLIVGRGNLRGGLEAMAYALADSRRRLFEQLVRWGGAIEGEEPAPFDRVAAYLEQLDAQSGLDAYFEDARRHLSPDRVIFTGYVEHHLLRHLFPCCDVAIFPSVVKEAAPLVVPEAMASGCFPIGTDYAGMAASLDVAAGAVPTEVGRLMRLRHDPAHTVRDIVDRVPRALDVAAKYRSALRDVAVSRYDWRNVAAELAREMRAMAGITMS